VRALDSLLPDYDVHEVHEVGVAADPARAVAALLALPVDADPVVRALFRIRGLRGGLSVGAALARLGFTELARGPGEVVLGGSGRPWRPTGGIGSFETPCPGDVRIAIDIRSDGTRLSTETRIAGTDAASRRAFRRYWRLVGPFSALIRRRWLAAVRRELA
jgi:hypothetical protein